MKSLKDFKVALITNWDQSCGISTYSKFLVDSMLKTNKNIRIFSEYKTKNDSETSKENYKDIEVVYCWRRRESIKNLKKEIKQFNPDAILVQHEYGIFPTVVHWYNLLTFIQDYPYVVALHSVYEHKDKFLCESPLRNVIVHTEEAKELLIKKGYTNSIEVIHHGCPEMNLDKNWNLYQTEHTVIQYGFGFPYKNFESTIRSIKILIEKYPEIYLTCFFSENKNNINIHDEYYNKLKKIVEELEIDDNVGIVRGFISDEGLAESLKTNKVCVLPYKTHPDHDVRGSSGASKIAMSFGLPLVVGECHLFDDLKSIGVPSSDNPEGIAKIIDRYFSDEKFYNEVIEKQKKFCNDNSWDNISKKYLEYLKKTIQG